MKQTNYLEIIGKGFECATCKPTMEAETWMAAYDTYTARGKPTIAGYQGSLAGTRDHRHYPNPCHKVWYLYATHVEKA